MRERRHDGDLRGHVNALPPARQRAVGERRQRAHRRLRPDPHRSLRDGDAHRLAALRARERHRAARRHDLQVGAEMVSVRAFLPEGRDRDKYQSRVLLAQPLVPQTPSVERPRREALKNEIYLFRQPYKQLPPARVFEVQSDPALVGVEGEPVQALRRALLAAQERRPAARRVAARWLDLDDIRAEVAEDFARQETERPRQVEHAVWSEQHHTDCGFRIAECGLETD